jgi:hypothetical protein
MRVEKFTLYREPSALKRWWNRQLTDYTIFGVEVEGFRVRWWPIVCFLLSFVWDTAMIMLVAMSDVAARSTTDMLFWPDLWRWLLV